MTLNQMKEYFFRLYGRRNRIFLSGLGERIKFLNLGIADLQEAIRKNYGPEILGIALARIVARIFCIAENFWSLPLVEMMARKYPLTHCAYCQKFPCECSERRPEAVLAESAEEEFQWNLKDWCKHLNDVYGEKNKTKGIENLINRLFKEVSELLSLEMDLSNSNADDNLDRIEERFALELADSLAWTIAVSNFLGMDLEREVLKRYGSGCWRCGKNPCTCSGFNMKPVKWEAIKK